MRRQRGLAGSQNDEPSNISHEGSLVWRAPGGPATVTEGPAAVPVDGGRAWPGQHTDTPTDWRPPRGLRGLARLRADAPSHTSATWRHWCGGRRRDLPRCRWAVAGPGRASRRRAERSSQRGRIAGGPPPTGTHSGRGLRRPEHQRGHTATPHVRRRHKQRKRAAAHRAAARSRSQCNTQRSRAATTSATWTAFRAAPLRRLSPETTRTRPRLPSTAWS